MHLIATDHHHYSGCDLLPIFGSSRWGLCLWNVWSVADRNAGKESPPYRHLAHHCPAVDWIPVARLRPRPDDHIGLITFEDIESAFERIQIAQK